MRIIVADDEQDMRDYFRTILTHWGHEVLAAAADGLELVEGATSCSPEMIITDLKMPKLNGDDAVRKIWEKCKVPVILISAYPCPQELSGNLVTAPLVYLNKPINRQQLREAIDSLRLAR